MAMDGTALLEFYLLDFISISTEVAYSVSPRLIWSWLVKVISVANHQCDVGLTYTDEYEIRRKVTIIK